MPRKIHLDKLSKSQRKRRGRYLEAQKHDKNAHRHAGNARRSH